MASSLVPPPSVADGAAPNPPTVDSFLNDYAQLRVPAGHTFTASNFVELPGVAIDDAFRMLCGPDGAEAICAAHAPFCNRVVLPLEPRRLEPERPESTAGYSNVAPMLAVLADEHHPAWATLVHFKIQEHVPLFFGLYNKYVNIEAWQIADRASYLARYTSNGDNGNVLCWKYRWLTPMEGGTRVQEYVVGVIKTRLFRGPAQSECRKFHAKHMSNYKLIDYKPAEQKQEQQLQADAEMKVPVV